MNGEVIILKNIPHEGPGLIETLLLEKGFRYRIIEVDENVGKLSISDIAALIVMGGPASANDKSPAMLSELKLIKEVVEMGIPYLGICLGLQVLVKAMGGKVVKCQEKEIGFRSADGEIYGVKKTHFGSNDKLFKGVPDSFRVFQLHGETVVLSAGMKILGAGDICANQIVRVGEKAYGLQFHPELTIELLNDWMKLDTDLKLLDPENLRAEFESFQQESEPAGRKLLQNFLDIVNT